MTAPSTSSEPQTFRVRLYKDPDDAAHWLADVLPDELGVHSFGTTREEALAGAREALGLAIGDAARDAVFEVEG